MPDSPIGEFAAGSRVRQEVPRVVAYAATSALLRRNLCAYRLLPLSAASYSGMFLPDGNGAHGASRSSEMSVTRTKYRVRECAGGEDYSAVIGSVDTWWGGRRVSPMLPRLFFENFCDTSFVVVTTRESAPVADGEHHDSPARSARQGHSTATRGERDENVVGFLCGFVSQSRVGEVRPGARLCWSAACMTEIIRCQ